MTIKTPPRWKALLRIGLDRLHTHTARALYRFAFTKSDRRAIGLLSCLIVLTLFLRAYGLVSPAKDWSITEEWNTGKVFRKPSAETAAMPRHETERIKTDEAPPPRPNTYKPPEYMVKKKFMVELNQADTFDLQEIYGIGPTFAKRIVRYRQTLGGFVDVEQLREVWGVDSTVLERIKPHVYLNPKAGITKINVNVTDLKTLKRHPYLDYYQAKEIYLHRQKHGAFSSVEEIRTVNLMDSGTFSRIAPYLSVE